MTYQNLHALNTSQWPGASAYKPGAYKLAQSEFYRRDVTPENIFLNSAYVIESRWEGKTEDCT